MRKETGDLSWKAASVVEERLKFVVLACQKAKPVSTLCADFGISRQTGHVWLRRYQQGGAKQIEDRSRRPLRSPGRTDTLVEDALVALRQERPDWGAPKLLDLLRQRGEGLDLSVRTAHRILSRHGLIREDTRQRPAPLRFERSQPNELWQMDFKGPQAFNKSSPVGPLSVLDDHSRYLLALEHLGSTRMAGVQATLRRTFEEAGLPEAMLVDHGTPWWNAASPWGLTELTVWIMRQGVRMLFSGIRHPQTQGKVERMHGALEAAVRRRRANQEDQTWLNQFREEYNCLRPHQGIGMATPASRWQRSSRQYRPEPAEWEYPSELEVVRLAGAGQLNWQGRRWEISNALRGQRVGIASANDRALVYYCNTPLRELDPATGASYPIPHDAIRSLQR